MRKTKWERLFWNEKGDLDPLSMHVNTSNLKTAFAKIGIEFEFIDSIGPILRCFGNLEVLNIVKMILPPMPAEEEQKTTKRVGRRAQARKKEETEVSATYEVEGVVGEFEKDRDAKLLPATVTLLKTSYNHF